MWTPPDEPERLDVLRSYRILDTPPEEAFDDLVRLASRICGTPIGLVSFVDEHRQWFKARIGLGVSETPREFSFCAQGLAASGPFVVKDARADERFASNPLVTGEPHIRFYAGAPLRTPSGHCLGAMCVIDHVPRELSPEQLDALEILSREVVSRLELRRHVLELSRAVESYERGALERQRVEGYQAAQQGATQALAEGLNVEDTIPRVLEAIAEAQAWDFGALWRRDAHSQVLQVVATWSDDPEATAAFDASSRAITGTRGVGLPGRIWEAGEFVYVADLQSDPNFLRAPAAARAGLRQGLGFPVSLGGDVLGVLEFFAGEMTAPTEELQRVLQGLGTQVAQFLERDASDLARRANDARMRSVIENMLEGLIVVNGRGLVESVNPAAEQIFGYPAWEIVGQPLKILLPHSVAGQADKFLADAYQRAIGRVTEWEGRRKSGDVFRFELSLYEFLSPDGRLLAGHVRDISDRQKLERMKKEFVATVSHELRTPLTSIRGSLSLLVSGVLGDLGADAREAVEIAERNTVRLIGLINDILDLERIESGKMEIHIEPLALASVFERSLEAVRGMADTLHVRLEAETPAARVKGDAERLVQVLVNLLSNAIKFSPRNEVVSVTSREEAGFAVVRVSDHGRGIPESYKDAIFQRFQQVESSDSRQKGGSGLGLAICKAIVEQHGGTIGVESERGKGSTFHFRIPLEAATLPEPS
jgi:PAS domain S-box-containing protein